MEQIEEGLALVLVKQSDHERLMNLMLEIYRPVYQHLWFDDGTGYLDRIYAFDALQNDLVVKGSIFYFIKLEGKDIGILKIVKDKKIPDISRNEPLVKLDRIYISPNYHGLGLGKKLVNWVFDTYCASNGAALWLEVMDSQQPAIVFYEKMGFEVIASFRLGDETMRSEYRGMYRMIKK